MRNYSPSPLSNHELAAVPELESQITPDVTELIEPVKSANWFSVLLFSIYFLSLWNAPQLPIPILGWEIVLGLAFLSYITQKSPLNLRAANIFWVVYGLGFLGAILSLLRAPTFDNALSNTVAMGIAFITFLLFIPLLATRQARRFILVLIVANSFLWTLEIRRLLSTHGSLIYSTFAETGSNKNLIGYSFVLAAVTLFYISVFWKPSVKVRNWQAFLIRWSLRAGCLWFIYHITLIYDRSSIMLSFVGIGVVLMMLVIKTPNKLKGLLLAVLALLIIILIVQYLIPNILASSPYWDVMYSKFAEQGFMGPFSNRLVLFRKGWYLIRQNPILGVGLGGSRAPVSDYLEFPGYFIHNAYLTYWAERGIFGLVSIFIWVLAYVNWLRSKILGPHLTDQIWSILFLLIFIAMIYTDSNTINMISLAVLAGIYYQQYQFNKANLQPFAIKNF